MPGAFEAAASGNFAIETDLQLSADGEAMVHHDDTLDRLTEGSGALLGTTAAELKAVEFKNTSERMMSLGDLCAKIVHCDGDFKVATGLGSRHKPFEDHLIRVAVNAPGR